MRIPKCITLWLLLASLTPLSTSANSQSTASLVIRQHAMANHPFTVVGEGGALLGSQDGVFELWQDPVKLLREFRITAYLDDYNVPLKMNLMPATIEVRPAETIITLAHAAITVREHLLIDRTGKLPRTAAIAYFEIHATRPGEIVFSFDPVMQRQWPAPNFGVPSSSWVTVPGGSGYILLTDNPSFYAAVAIPGTTPGAPPPYQERTLMRPLELHLRFNPLTDDGRLYPLLSAVSGGTKPATPVATQALLNSVLEQQSLVPDLVHANEQYYSEFFARSLELSTPDASFNEAFRWAEVSIDQSRTRSPEGIGLAAGWSASDDTARPGFGWFFGRDTLWSLYAVNSYGDFELSRQAMDFLLRHQRADGKMMHEYSQTAGLVDWDKLPYLYAAADATPLFLMQMRDYIRYSGDMHFLSQHWQNVRLAYQFVSSHRENGLYSNAEGTGWVEEWPGPRPHQEIYLAALDAQACDAVVELARWSKDPTLAAGAEADGKRARQQIATYRQPSGWYAFSRNQNGTFDNVPTIFPAVAWWDDPKGLPGADTMFDAWAGGTFSVDWGIRSVSSASPIYDPISYHHGSVWPLYAGWVALAEYRAGRTLQAASLVRQTLQLDQLQDLGATTEVLSGEFLEPLSRSSSHQLWSSAMAISPVVRGLLGVEPDAPNHTLQLDPHLPAAWDRVLARRLRIGNDSFDLTLARHGPMLQVEARSASATVLCLTQHAVAERCGATPATVHTLSIPLPPVEVDFGSLLPTEGSRSSAMHVLHQESTAHTLALVLEAPAGSDRTLSVRRNLASAEIRVQGGELAPDGIHVHFPEGDGYVRRTLTATW
jgi:hypothetical protein